MNYFLIGLGSNIDPTENMPRARETLSTTGTVIDQSAELINPPCGSGFDGMFHNQLLILKSALPERELKAKFEQIEIDMGREPKTPQRKFNNRTIDIDILATESSVDLCLQTQLKDSYNQTIMSSWHPDLSN